MHFFLERLPAECSDARALDGPLTDGTLDLDDSFEDNDGQVILRCFVPVYVYYRETRVQAEASIQAQSHGATAVESLRHRQVEVGVMCNRDGHPGLGAFYPHCSFQKGWSCFTGECTAYEKARRLCASQIHRDAYPCSYVPGEPRSGVEDADVSYPTLELTFALVTTMWLLQCTCLLVVQFKRDCKDDTTIDDCRSYFVDDLLALFGHTCRAWSSCVLGMTFLIGVVYYRCVHGAHRQPNEQKAYGTMTYSLRDLDSADLQNEEPVHISFWLLELSPPLVSQVAMVSGAVLLTLYHQISTFCCQQRHVHVYAALPQSPRQGCIECHEDVLCGPPQVCCA